MEQKARQHHRRDELEGSQARAAGKGKHRTSQWLEVRSDLLERDPQVCRGMVPEFVNLGADDRPRLDAFRRRRNEQGAGAKLASKVLQAIDHAVSKPCHRSNHDRETDDRNDRGRQLRPIAEMHRQPVVRRVQGHRQNHAPYKHRDEWTNKDERPVNEEGQQTEAERQLNDFCSGCRLSKYPLGHHFALADARNGPSRGPDAPDRTSPDIGSLLAPAQARA